MDHHTHALDRLVRDALAVELSLEHKPGLVTPSACGSHRDMDRMTFEASIAALSGYFGDCARLAALGCDFSLLQQRGLAAERAMFDATHGVNTHKGAVFTLGLLSAAVGQQIGDGGRLQVDALGDVVASTWGDEILASFPKSPRPTTGIAPLSTAQARHEVATHGIKVRTTLGLPGAREQAASGFPVLFETTYPALVHALDLGLDAERAGLHALLATIAVLPDTNLAHRGGMEGLDWARSAARAFLDRGGIFTRDWREVMASLCAAFEHRWLSPGGSADLLAAAWMLRMLDTSMHFAASPPISASTDRMRGRVAGRGRPARIVPA